MTVKAGTPAALELPAGRLSPRDFALLALLAIAFFLPGINRLSPTDRDESRYAVATSQMLQSGNFVDVRFQDQPRYLQPAGIYWLQSLSVSALSSEPERQIWAYRVPSFLGGVIAVLFTAAIGAFLFGRKAGLGAGALMAMCFVLNFETRIAKIDATMLGVVTAAQYALMRVYFAETGGATRKWAAMFWALIGAGLMLKGPIPFIVNGLTIGALTLWDRDPRWLKRLHAGWGVLLSVMIAAPWLIAIGIESKGEFFRIAIGKSLLGKVAVSQQGHVGPPGYHLALFTFTFWPGSLLAGLAVPRIWRNRLRPQVKFLLCWILPAWVVFELVSTKLPHYLLPVFPAIACLAAAMTLDPQFRQGSPRRWWAILVAVIWAPVAIGVALAPSLLPYLAENRIDGLAVAVSGLSLIVLAVACWLLWRGRPVPAMAALGAAAFVLYITAYTWVLPNLNSVWLSPRIA
ncbi:MAG: ArnT family glycosyltransferase, partial [Caulobacteraceae bacterium]